MEPGIKGKIWVNGGFIRRIWDEIRYLILPTQPPPESPQTSHTMQLLLPPPPADYCPVSGKGLASISTEPFFVVFRQVPATFPSITITAVRALPIPIIRSMSRASQKKASLNIPVRENTTSFGSLVYRAHS